MKTADVSFDVQQIKGGLTLVGKEKGATKFTYTISNFSNFTEYTGGNFAAMRLENEIRWRYMSPSEQFYEISVNSNGDMEMLDSPQTNTVDKTFAFRTAGTLKNQGSQAFYKLYLSANQFHNYGAIQMKNYHFFNNYSFNSGVLKSGETPTGIADLRAPEMKNSAARPNYRHGVIENYGKIISSNTLRINDGLSYTEHNESVFEDLEMTGGDITVNNGSMNISGKLSGTVNNMSASCQSSLYINDYNATRTGNYFATGGTIYTSELCHNKINQELVDLTQEQTALEKFKNATRVTPEQAYERYQRIKRGEKLYSDQTIAQIQREQPNNWREIMAMDEWGLQGGGIEFVAGTIFTGVVAVASGSSHRSVSVGVSSSGHVAIGPNSNSVNYQLRRQRNRDREFEQQVESAVNHPSYLPNNNLSNYIPQRNPDAPYWKELGAMPRKVKLARELYDLFMPINLYQPSNHKNRPSPLTQIYNAYNMKVDTTQYQTNRTYYSKLYKSMKDAGIPHQDILSVYGNPYLSTATGWNGMSYSKQQGIRNQYPGIDNVAKGISSVKYDFANVLSKTTPEIRQFVNDFAIPITTISSMYKGTPTNLKQVANKLGAFLCDVAYEFDKAFIPGFAAYASGGSVGDIVTSAGSDLVLMYCGGKFVQVGWKGIQSATYAGAQMLSKTSTLVRPTWQQTEQYLCKLFGKKSKSQVSYLYGKPVSYGTKNSVRPDFIINGKKAVEAKNYDIAKNTSGLISKVVEQVNKRAIHLPKGMKQEIQIDIRGQKVTRATFKQIQRKIVEKCKGTINEDDIKWIGGFTK